MKEVKEEIEKTQAEILLLKIQHMGVMMMLDRKEEAKESFIDAHKICHQMIRQGL
tara:strand:- start:447 stop:611 length:165 start_codon:yes stop_codon:yes gene_type:complete